MARRGGKQSRFSKSIKRSIVRIRGSLKRRARAVRAALGAQRERRPQLTILDLPLEIREQIWRRAVGDMHLAVSHSTIVTPWTMKDDPWLVTPVWESDMPVYDGEWKFVNLLLTCRQIYREAVYYVYATSLIEFRTATGMSCMRSRTRDKWHMIRKIALCWDVICQRDEDSPIDPFYWVSTCGMIGYMDNLEVIYFVVDRTRTLSMDYLKVSGELSLLALRPVVIKTVILHPAGQYSEQADLESTVNPEFYNDMRDLGILWFHARFRAYHEPDILFAYILMS